MTQQDTGNRPDLTKYSGTCVIGSLHNILQMLIISSLDSNPFKRACFFKCLYNLLFHDLEAINQSEG